MQPAEAVAFLRPAVDPKLRVWADLGAGSGTFTAALAHILDGESTIYAVDNDGGALRRVTRQGRIVLVEYDRATANPWVPFPIPLDRARDLACAAGLAWEGVVAQRRSAYQGTLYCAVLSPVRTDSRAELETPS